MNPSRSSVLALVLALASAPGLTELSAAGGVWVEVGKAFVKGMATAAGAEVGKALAQELLQGCPPPQAGEQEHGCILEDGKAVVFKLVEYLNGRPVYQATLSSLIGRWSQEGGEGVFRTVRLYEFKVDGSFSQTLSQPGLQQEKRITGRWALKANSSRLVIDYDEPQEVSSGALFEPPKRMQKVDYVVVVGFDELFGRETLRLMPPSGELFGTDYLFRAP